MKVVLNSGHGKEVDVGKAVADKLYPNAYSYSGELEKVKCQIELQSELIARLIECICNNGHLRVEQLEEILGYSYVVKQ